MKCCSRAPRRSAAGQSIISADDLGLADVDKLERRVPGVFTPLEDRAVNGHRSTLDRLAPDLPEAERQLLAAVLDGLEHQPAAAEGCRCSSCSTETTT